MRRTSLVTIAALVLIPVTYLAQTPGNTVWDGVYSEAQAGRGQKAFSRSCGGCHRDDASGGDDGEPPLRGPTFLHKWDDSTVAALYDFIASNMPRNKPGSVSLTDCIDIVAYLLQLNEMTAGSAELTTDIDQLGRVRFTERRPAK